MIRMDGLSITTQTLVGVMGTEYPLQGGNCFSLLGEDGKSWRIVNFKVENLEELIRRGTISFPVEMEIVTDRVAILVDSRIPAGWDNKRYCRCCCPVYYQRDHVERWSEREKRITRTTNPETGEVFEVERIEIKPTICVGNILREEMLRIIQCEIEQELIKES